MSANAWKARRGNPAYREQRATVEEWRKLEQQERWMAEAMLACLYYRRSGDRTCTAGCYSEPMCETMRPHDGWESRLVQRRRVRYHRPRLETS